MSRLRLPPHALGVRKEADSGRGRMALQPSHTPSVGARRISPLAVPPLPRVAPSAAGAPVAPQRSLAPAAQQDGHSGKVLRRPPEEWRGVGVHISVRATIGASVVVKLWPTCRRRRCAAVRLVCSRTALAPVDVPLMGSPCTGTSCAGHRSSFPSRVWPCTSTPYASCRSRGSASKCSRASSSSSWRLASSRSSSRAHRWVSTPRWRGASSGSELLDIEATQMLHSRVGSWRRVVRAL
jgi:hypothetical protein